MNISHKYDNVINIVQIINFFMNWFYYANKIVINQDYVSKIFTIYLYI